MKKIDKIDTFNWGELVESFERLSSIPIALDVLKEEFIKVVLDSNRNQFLEHLILQDEISNYWKLNPIIPKLFETVDGLIEFVKNNYIENDFRNEILDFMDLHSVVTGELGITYYFNYVRPRNYRGELFNTALINDFGQLIFEISMPLKSLKQTIPNFDCHWYEKNGLTYLIVTIGTQNLTHFDDIIQGLKTVNPNFQRINFIQNSKLEKDMILLKQGGRDIIKIRSIQPPIRKSDEPNYEIY